MASAGLQASITAGHEPRWIGYLDARQRPANVCFHRVSVRGRVDLERLLLFHRAAPPAPGASGSLSHEGDTTAAFRLSTCQREIEVHFATLQKGASDACGETYRGVEAYQALLEIATGLRSAIPGETNVFGQLRAAWREYLRAVPHRAKSPCSELMDTLFTDTRAIRTRFLQDIGGHSYGTLTRKLLRAAPGARVLIVGNGELARSIAPMLTGFELAIINRSRSEAAPGHVRHVFDVEEAPAAVNWADHVVMCVPRQTELDARWLPLLASRGALRVIHLGCRRADAGPWAQLRGLLTLDDLFDLRLAQQDRRSRQLELARAACRTRALLRAAESQTALQLPRGIA